MNTLELPPQIKPLFADAGWNEHKPTSAQPLPESAQEIALRIFDEFGGLTVGQCGPGAQGATSDIRFYETLDPHEDEFAEPWRETTGPLTAFAAAHLEYLILYVGARGRFYIHAIVNGKLIEVPGGFGELMRRLLGGYNYGIAIPEDRER